MNLIIAQFSHIPPNSKIFSAYLEAECKKQKIDLVVVGEYVANHFFKEYHTKGILKREFELQKAYFGALSKELNIAIVAPLIECVGEKIYKSIAIFEGGKVRFYRAKWLMEFSHWNEGAFFDNVVYAKNCGDFNADSRPKSRTLRPKEPIIFSVGGFKVSAIFGWEAHFDEIFIKLRKKGVDILCVPTASSFGSNARWQRLMQTRAFLNSCFVVRVNRTGRFMASDFKESSVAWDFYGESFIALPDGSLGDMMGEKDGILVSEIRTEMLDEIKDSWRFR